MSGNITEQSRGNKSGIITEDIIKIPNFTGMVQAFGTSTVPKGWLLCNGAAISRSTYVDLFTAIGTTWGVGDGSSTFNVPRLQAAFLRCGGAHTSQMGNTNAFTGSNLGTISNDSFQRFNLGAQTARVKVGGPDTGWGFIGRQIGQHGMAYRTGAFYYDHTQGGVGPYSNQFYYNGGPTDKGGTGVNSGGTSRRGGETKPLSASVEYMIKY